MRQSAGSDCAPSLTSLTWMGPAASRSTIWCPSTGLSRKRRCFARRWRRLIPRPMARYHLSSSPRPMISLEKAQGKSAKNYSTGGRATRGYAESRGGVDGGGGACARGGGRSQRRGGQTAPRDVGHGAQRADPAHLRAGGKGAKTPPARPNPPSREHRRIPTRR